METLQPCRDVNDYDADGGSLEPVQVGTGMWYGIDMGHMALGRNLGSAAGRLRMGVRNEEVAPREEDVGGREEGRILVGVVIGF